MMRVTQCLFVAAVCSWAAFAAAQPPPVEAYGRLPAIGGAALSPDGKRLALSVGFEFQSAEPDRELTAVRILNVDTGAIEHTLAPPPGNTLRMVGWAGERLPFYYISRPANSSDLVPSSWPVVFRGSRIEIWRTGVLSLDTGVATLMMQTAEFRANAVLADLHAPLEGEADFGRMIARSNISVQFAMPKLAVYRVNLKSGAAIPVESGNVQTTGFLLGASGEVVARVDVNDRNNRWRLFVPEGGKERMILEDVSEMGMPIQLYGLLEDGRIAAVNQHEDGARDTLLAIDRQTGKSSPLHTTAGSDVSAISDPWLHRVVGVSWIDDLPKQLFFDAQLKALADAVQPHFSDGYATVVSWSRDRSRALVFGERANDAGAYYVYDQATNKFRSVGKTYPALTAPEHLGERSAIKYRSRDGTSIPAYLTLPAGIEPRNLPLVLLVHGGPHARDDFTFDWWASFLASRGYAVLQTNFRGSTGYGYEWFNRGRGQWGDGLMQTDVEDGAAALVKSGYVDAARICIMGGSYGGYAALAGATLTPEKYACAVSVNGLSDPERLLNNAQRSYDGKRGMMAEWWRKSMGADLEHLRKVSPINHADQVRAPVLILHGVDDSVVAVEQSRWMTGRLRDAKKNVRFVELRGDDHWLSSASTRTQMLHEVETFLAEHLGPKK